MSQQAHAQRIGAYAWCLILAIAGGALVIGALGGSPGEEPAMLLAEEEFQAPRITANQDGEFDTGGAGISHVSSTEGAVNGP